MSQPSTIRTTTRSRLNSAIRVTNATDPTEATPCLPGQFLGCDRHRFAPPLTPAKAQCRGHLGELVVPSPPAVYDGSLIAPGRRAISLGYWNGDAVALVDHRLPTWPRGGPAASRQPTPTEAADPPQSGPAPS
jgi:hypothetical protein